MNPNPLYFDALAGDLGETGIRWSLYLLRTQVFVECEFSARRWSPLEKSVRFPDIPVAYHRCGECLVGVH